eukprot:6354663-Amphidinium_carterae.1
MEYAHGPHRLEPVPRERPLEAVFMYRERHDCAHPCNGSNAALWNRSFETIAVYLDISHGPQRLEPSPRERPLEAVLLYPEPRDCAHPCNAAL